MTLSPLTVSITAVVAPTGSFVLTVPSIISVDIEALSPLTAAIGVTLPAPYMSLLSFSHTGSGGCRVGGAAAIVGDPYIWVGSGGLEVAGSASISVTYSIAVGGGAQVGGAATESSYALNPRLAIGLTPMTVSLAGYYSVLTARVPAISASATGILGGTGALGVRFPAALFSSGGGTQSCAVMLSTLRVTAAGTQGTLGTMSVKLPVLHVEEAGAGVFTGAMAVLVPPLRTSAVGKLGGVGQLRAALKGLQADLVGEPGLLGNLETSFLPLGAQLSGYPAIGGSLSATLPAFSVESIGLLRAQMQLFLVANTKTAAVSTYEGVAANSLCRFNGMTLMADATGVHVMDADDDNGTPIDAEATFGKLDLGSRSQKRVVDAYIGLRAAGDMVVGVSVDEGDECEFTLSTAGVERLKERRVKLARGLKGMYWQMSVRNVDGCDFDADKIELAVQDNDRKI